MARGNCLSHTLVSWCDQSSRSTRYGCASQDSVVSARFQSSDCKIRYKDTSTTFVLEHDFRTPIMPAQKARVRVELCV